MRNQCSGDREALIATKFSDRLNSEGVGEHLIVPLREACERSWRRGEKAPQLDRNVPCGMLSTGLVILQP